MRSLIPTIGAHAHAQVVVVAPGRADWEKGDNRVLPAMGPGLACAPPGTTVNLQCAFGITESAGQLGELLVPLVALQGARALHVGCEVWADVCMHMYVCAAG